jgi:hypothetical protein
MKERKLELTSASLHILAMAFMLCDHMWATVIPGNQWLTVVGRLTYPIYAFLLVEGYFHTGNLKKYALRLLALVILSEIPFNLMYSSQLFYPVHQNVIWTLLVGLGCVHINERAKEAPLWRRILTGAATAVVGGLLGIVLFSDYNAAGIWTILVFYWFRGRAWWNFAGQAALLYYINVEVLQGLAFEVELFGETHFIVQQGFALLALIPIWLYRGRKGMGGRGFRYACYAFYPLHMLVLYWIRSVI